MQSKPKQEEYEKPTAVDESYCSQMLFRLLTSFDGNEVVVSTLRKSLTEHTSNCGQAISEVVEQCWEAYARRVHNKQLDSNVGKLGVICNLLHQALINREERVSLVTSDNSELASRQAILNTGLDFANFAVEVAPSSTSTFSEGATQASHHSDSTSSKSSHSSSGKLWLWLVIFLVMILMLAITFYCCRQNIKLISASRSKTTTTSVNSANRQPMGLTILHSFSRAMNWLIRKASKDTQNEAVEFDQFEAVGLLDEDNMEDDAELLTF